MANHISISFLNPVKFYPVDKTDGHFDSDWSFNRIPTYQTRSFYAQKWQRGDTTPIQFTATLTPGPIHVYDCNQVLHKSINFSQKISGGASGVNIYEAVIDLDDLPDGTYYLYNTTTVNASTFKFISEPIMLRNTWPNTMLFTYYNSYNDLDMVFTTGAKFKFRCEAGIPPSEFQPDTETTDYIDQIHNPEILSGTPYRTFKLFIGTAPGVAPFIADILNRIFVCNTVLIDGKQFVKPASAKWEITRNKLWAQVGLQTEILEAKNLNSIQLNSLAEDSQIPGLVTTYSHETNFWGTGSEVLITEIEITP